MLEVTEFNILVIDNSKGALENIASYLEIFDHRGYRLTRSIGFENGFQMFQQGEFDLVLIEQDLDGARGDQLVVQIEKTNKSAFMFLFCDRFKESLGNPYLDQCLCFNFPHDWNVGLLNEEAYVLAKAKNCRFEEGRSK